MRNNSGVTTRIKTWFEKILLKMGGMGELISKNLSNLI